VDSREPDEPLLRKDRRAGPEFFESLPEDILRAFEGEEIDE